MNILSLRYDTMGNIKLMIIFFKINSFRSQIEKFASKKKTINPLYKIMPPVKSCSITSNVANGFNAQNLFPKSSKRSKTEGGWTQF